jgi:Reverse transcriptase (RNA-dependent DNA polymerase)
VKECLTLVAEYVDDIIVASDDKIYLQETVDPFKEKMPMTIMGDISFLLGMEIKRKKKYIFLTQTLYINRLAQKFAVKKTEKKMTLIKSGTTISAYDEASDKPTNQTEYGRVIGGSLYISTSTRPDISFAVGRMSKYLEKPSTKNMDVAKLVIQYLLNTDRVGLRFNGKDYVDISVPTLEWYRDADLGGPDLANKEILKCDCRSISGIVIQVNGNMITYASKTQTCVSKSSTESELYAGSAGITQTEFLIKIIYDIYNIGEIKIKMYNNNLNTIGIFRNRFFNSATRYI